MTVTVEDLKREVGGQEWDLLTEGEASVAERAIERARIWIVARFRRCGREPDFGSEIVREAWLKRALYELYSRGESEGVAQDKKEDAEDLLAAYLGDCGEAEARGSGPVAARMRRAEPTPLASEFAQAVRGR